jgi:RNA polymerase sigma-70 factor (ECF subfamily)
MLLHTISDQQLVSNYLDGNVSALEALVNRHRNRIYTFIISKVRNQALAEDIFQDAFFKVIKSLQQGKYNEEGKFLPWVMRISHNLVIDHFRKVKRMPIAGKPRNNDDTFDIFDVIGNGDQTKEDVMIEDEQHNQLRQMIKELPEEQRQVLLMRHYEELSFKEIAEKTGVSINTALGRMRYALINLRKIMEEHNIDLVIQ